MDIQYRYLKWIQSERDITNMPWVKKLPGRKRKASSPTGIDDDKTLCNNRLSYKLRSICPQSRSSMETESWRKVLDHAEKQARLRAVQMHLSCVSTLTALPFALACCGCKPLPAASAVMDGLTTEEIEREWIYDTGAACAFIGWDHLTDQEKKRTYKVDNIDVTTAGGLRACDTAVMCNIPYLGKRQVRVLKDCPPAISVRREVLDHNVTFNYTRENGPILSLGDGTRVYLWNDEWRHVPVLNGYCATGSTGKPSSRKEKSQTHRAAGLYVRTLWTGQSMAWDHGRRRRDCDACNDSHVHW